MPHTEVPTTYDYLALTANFWGRGASEQAALQKVRDAGGSSSLKKYGYAVYLAHPETRIDPVDGGFIHPRECSPIKIIDKRKIK